MQRPNGSLAHRARPLFVVITLVASVALAFTPGVPVVIALSPSPDPGQSIAPDPTPSVAPDPTPSPAPDPTPDPSPAESAGPTPEPSPTPSPEPAPAPVADPSPTPSVTAEPAATATPHAVAFDATQRQSAATAEAGAFHLTTFTIETWFARHGSGTGDPIGTGGVGTSTGTGGLGSAIPLVTRGAADPDRAADVPPPAADRVNWFLGIDADTGVLVADFQDAADGSNHPISGVTVLAADTWYHAAATYDGTTWRLYLNGRLEAERLVGDLVPESTGGAPVALATSVAADVSTARGFFDGTLDETRIWDIARTAREIRDGMNRPIEKTAAGLVAAWAMDEGAGTTATDASASNAALALAGGATWIDSPVPDDTVPAAPRSLAADGGPGGVALAWAAVDAPDLAGYNVYRSAAGPVSATGDPLNGRAPVKPAAYVDDTANAGVTYRYAITAVDRYANESDLSAEATATPPPVSEPTSAPTPPPLVDVKLTITSDAPAEGRHRIDPGAALGVTVSLVPATDLSSGRLAVGLPEGWTIREGAGGVSDERRGRLSWDLADVAAGVPVVRHIELVAPLASPVDGGLDFESTFSAAFEQAGGVSDGPRLAVLVAPLVAIEHRTLGQVDGLTLTPTYLAEDAAILDEQRFEVFRVRFQVRNADDLPVRITPQLEFRPATGGEFAVVPAPDGQAGIPFYVAREWTPVTRPEGGTELGPQGEEIGESGLKAQHGLDAGEKPSRGHHSMGENPAPPLIIPPRSSTEVEFSVRATVDAPYLAAYEFRVTDAGAAIPGAVTAGVQLGAEPPLLLSPGQRQGLPVGDPLGSSPAGSVAYRLSPPDIATVRVSDASAIAAVETTAGGRRYALLAVATSPGTGGNVAPAALGTDPAHGPFSGSTDACAICHGAHSAQGPNLLNRAGPQSSLCFTCHDSAGSGASTRVQAQYTDPAVPANDPSTGSYFQHDALATGSGHSQAHLDEFGGQLDRHTECADCHNPHAATNAVSTQTTGGWTAPGQLAGISGVSVANGSAAGSTPSYTFLDGVTAPITLEYQLCFKCHAGFTTLPSRATLHPSWWAEDKGTELNPANTSFHPVEAAGKNTSTAMANSLAGTSPYKLWVFTIGSTVRCVNCHGDPRKVAAWPAAGSDLAPHAVPSVVAADGTQLNRGLLLQPYRDRILKGPADFYNSTDSALCLGCHKEAPFVDVSGNARTDTNFRLHGKHVSSLRNKGAGIGDIDTAGAGRGNAICSECHFRIHSTSSVNDFRTGTLQTGTDAGLVIFAPNVGKSSTTNTISWTRTGTSSGTCAITCHGQDHEPKSY